MNYYYYHYYFRYSRDGYNLVISSFRKSDAGRKCCNIDVSVPGDNYDRGATACTDVVYIGTVRRNPLIIK